MLHTYQVGRRTFNHRRILVCETIDAAIALETAPQRVRTFHSDRSALSCLCFQGRGAVREYGFGTEVESVFREQIDLCSELKPYLGLDLRQVFYPSEDQAEAATQHLRQTVTQPALFVIEYAWLSCGCTGECVRRR